MIGDRLERSAARPPDDRRRRRPIGEREAIGDRPTTRLGKAETAATLQGQSGGDSLARARVDATAIAVVTTPREAAKRPVRPPEARRADDSQLI
ncbi:MAG: hypothetical protein HYV60_19185 [Planctomycetia bacterium]|nr:hypothetical protein [Planctomycetia bacterium]